MEPTLLAARVLAELRVHADRAVVVRGDQQANYGQVLSAMVLLKNAGVKKVGLMTQNDE
jgi:biopolymer transport protein TolR